MIDGQNVVDIPLTEAGASKIDEEAHSQLSVWASNPSYRTLRDGSLFAENPGTACQATIVQSLRDGLASEAMPESIRLHPQFVFLLFACIRDLIRVHLRSLFAAIKMGSPAGVAAVDDQVASGKEAGGIGG